MRRAWMVVALLVAVLPAMPVDRTVAAAAAPERRAPAEPRRAVTLPVTLDHNRMIVEVEFVRPDGGIRKALAWVDTGNPDLMMGELLARELGLALPEAKGERAPEFVQATSPAPAMRFGSLPLDVEGLKTQVRVGSRVMPGVPAEACLPAKALRHLHVVLDYPARRMTVARPGVLKPRGTALPCRVNAETGLFLVAATLDGESVPLGVDNGSAGTWVSDTLTSAWQARHPDWPRATGAVGSANFFGFPFEARGVLMRLPEIGIGALRARGVGLLGLDQSLFDWYSRKSAGPVLGFIGANVLEGFRLEIDFPNQMTWWQAGAPGRADDFDIVGLTLRPMGDSAVVVAGVVTKDGRPVVEGVQPGDRLLRVGALEVATATMGAVEEALRGKPGAARTLVLERGGERLTVEARVTRLP